MFGTINELEIPAPSQLSITNEVFGGFTTTINGSKREHVNAIKKRWTLTYKKLTCNEYDDLYNELEKEISTGLQLTSEYATFNAYEISLNIVNEKVLIDIPTRDFSGDDFRGDLQIILTQV